MVAVVFGTYLYIYVLVYINVYDNEKSDTYTIYMYYSVRMKFGPAVRFREAIVSGSESVAGRLWMTDKSRTAADDDDGAGGNEKKKLTVTKTRRRRVGKKLHLYVFYCVKKKTSSGMSSGVLYRNAAAENWWRELMKII